MPAPTFTAQVMAALGRLKLFATAQLPASAPPGQLVYDTTIDGPKVCQNDGVTFATLSVGGGATGFDAITTGTNTTAAMVVSTGASLLVQDAVFGIIGSADPSKILRFEVDGFTAANTRVMTIPGTTGNDTLMTLANPGTVTGTPVLASGITLNTNTQGFILGSTALGNLTVVTTQTPDSPVFYTGTTSNALHFAEFGDAAFDFNNGLSGIAAATSSAVIIHGAAQNVTEYNHINVYGSHGGNVTALADNVATTFMHSPALTAGQIYAGTGTYAVRIVDAANETQVAVGTFEWYIMRGNTGGTVAGIQQVGNDGVLPGLPLQAVSSGTLTVALSVSVAANVASFQMTANTSLTATTFTMTTQMNVRTGPAEMLID